MEIDRSEWTEEDDEELRDVFHEVLARALAEHQRRKAAEVEPDFEWVVVSLSFALGSSDLVYRMERGMSG